MRFIPILPSLGRPCNFYVGGLEVAINYHCVFYFFLLPLRVKRGLMNGVQT